MIIFRPLSRRPLPSLILARNSRLSASLSWSSSFAKNKPTSILASNTAAVRASSTRPSSSLETGSVASYPSSMAAPTTSIDQLVRLTSDLSLGQIRDKFPNCYPETNPIHVYRLHVTSILEKITGVDPAIIYPAVQWTSGLDKGDLVMAVPALRVKGKKPDELAKEWAEKVC